MATNEPSRSVLYRALAILAGLSISIGGFAVGFILDSIQSDIQEIKGRIAPNILPRAEERFRSVEQRLIYMEGEIMDLEDDVRDMRGEISSHLRSDHE